MQTTLTVALSAQLQQTLSSTAGGGQVGVWAVYFTDDGNTAHATPLAVHGGGLPASETTFALPAPFNGGKIYFLVQSVDSGSSLLTFGPTGDIKTESQMNWNDADTLHFRYDSFEVSLLGQASDAGNLTNVNAFGFPMSAEIAFPNGTPTQTRGYAVDGSAIFDDIASAFGSGGGLIHDFTTGPLKDTPRLAAAPATVLSTPGLTGASASDFYAYLESFGNEAAQGVHIAGQFNGAGTVEYVIGAPNSYSEWHNAGFYSYTMAYDAAPLTVHQGSSALGANPFHTVDKDAAITITDPNASQYVIGQQISFSGVTPFAGYTAAELNQTFTIVNVIAPNNQYVVIAPGNKQANETTDGGGSNVESAIPLAENPFSATAGDSFFTVYDPNAAGYANTGVEVTFAGVTAFTAFPGLDPNGTTFTITKMIDTTHYEVATSVAASQTVSGGGGASVSATYVRPYAGTFVFTPDSNSQVKGTIEISSQDLANSIYSTLGNAHVNNPDGTPYQFTGLDAAKNGIATPNLNTGVNDQWGALFVKLLTGLLGGYVGGEGAALNTLLGPAGALNFSQNWNFDPTFAFHANMATPWTWDPAKYGQGAMFDAYARVFFDNTNSYGNGYSDALMSLFQEGGPLMSTGYPVPLLNNPYSTTDGLTTVTVHDSNAGTYGYAVGDLVTFAGGSPVAGIDMTAAPLIGSTGVNAFVITGVDAVAGTYTVDTLTRPANQTTTGGGTGVVAGLNVGNIKITLFDDGETPPSGQTVAEHQSYTPTEIYNTYDAALGALVAPRAAGHSADLDLQFGLGLGQMRPRDDLTVKLGFYSSTTGGVATFDYVAFDTSTQSLFQTWQYNDTTGAFEAKGQAAASGVSLQINDLPYRTGVNWYQLVFQSADGTVTRAYNLYLDAEQGTGKGIVNPAFSGNSPDAVAIDGLATYVRTGAASEYLTSLVFNMFSGGTLSMDPALLGQITDPTVIAANGLWPQPEAPVLGTLGGVDGNTFANWGGSGAAAVPNDPTQLGAVSQGALAFGWYAADQTWLNNDVLGAFGGVIAKYTNKIGALDVASVEFSSTAGFTYHKPVTALADIDGKWVTHEAQFGNGTYQATFNEYTQADTDFSTPLGKASKPLEFTVAIPDLQLGGSGTNAITVTPDSSGATGNWLTLTATGSTLPNGTLLAYATDALGNLVGRDGHVGASFADSVLAQIGLVSADGGSAVLFSGAHSVFLPVGLQLHFAIESGNGTVTQLPNMVVSGSDTLSVAVSGAAGTFNLTAAIGNTLSTDANLAETQRELNQPFVYLTEGQDVNVSVAGSAGSINSVHFVRMDVDLATGKLSVGGVPYGNTDAFRQAVQDHWDDNFVASGGRGTFTTGGAWDVSSGTGYYTPVLKTESGDIFMAGTANIDGQDHVRMFGQNTFGFEDLRAGHSDFDYNDMVVKLTTT
jgi:hypothetical protein